MAVGHEAPGHRASTVRKQREVKAGLSPRSSLCSVLDSSLGNGSLLLCSAFLETLLKTHKGVFHDDSKSNQVNNEDELS